MLQKTSFLALGLAFLVVGCGTASDHSQVKSVKKAGGTEQVATPSGLRYVTFYNVEGQNRIPADAATATLAVLTTSGTTRVCENGCTTCKECVTEITFKRCQVCQACDRGVCEDQCRTARLAEQAQCSVLPGVRARATRRLARSTDPRTNPGVMQVYVSGLEDRAVRTRLSSSRAIEDTLLAFPSTCAFDPVIDEAFHGYLVSRDTPGANRNVQDGLAACGWLHADTASYIVK